MSNDAELIALLDEIAEERSKGTRIQRGLVLGVLIMFAIFSFNTYRKINNFDTKAFMLKLQENAAQRVWPEVYYELNNVSKVAIPAISDSLTKELTNLGPKLSDKFASESVELEKNLGNYIQTSLKRELDMEFAKHKDTIETKYKDSMKTDEMSEELTAQLQAHTQQWAQSQLDEIFTDHIKILQSINETVMDMQKEATQEGGEVTKASMEDLVLIVSEILSARLGEK